MKRSIRIGLALISSAVLTTAAYAGETRNFFKVGVITELSGDLASGGNVTKRGYDLWAQEVNAKGGIDIKGKKYQVKLFYADAQSNPAAGASAAERLITQEQVDFILGPYSSGVTLAVAPITEKYKIPMITGSAESPLIWTNKFYYTFGTVPPVNYTGTAPIKVLSEIKPGPKTTVIIASNDSFSKATAEAFKSAAEAVKIKVLKVIIVPAGQDLTPLLSAVRGMKPDLIAFGGHNEELIKLVKSLRQINYTPKALLMHAGVPEPSFTQALGKDADQVFGASVWTPSIKTRGKILWPNAASYAAAAEKTFKVPPEYTQAASTTAGIAFQAALQKIGATPGMSEEQRKQLVKGLESLDEDTFYGKVKFATSGQFYHANVGMIPLTIQIQNGKPTVVGPVASQEAKPQYPMTEWKDR